MYVIVHLLCLLSFLSSIRLFQLKYIYTGFLPRILREIFKCQCQKNQAFKEEFGDGGWDDSKEQREWIADSLLPKRSNYSCHAVKDKSFTEWDVTNFSAALKVVVDPLHPVSAVDDVKDQKNALSHLAKPEVPPEVYKEHKKWMEKLIEQGGFQKKDKAHHMEQLRHLTSSELQLCYSIFYCT